MFTANILVFSSSCRHHPAPCYYLGVKVTQGSEQSESHYQLAILFIREITLYRYGGYLSIGYVGKEISGRDYVFIPSHWTETRAEVWAEIPSSYLSSSVEVLTDLMGHLSYCQTMYWAFICPTV
jgi:hypothetical protein